MHEDEELGLVDHEVCVWLGAVEIVYRLKLANELVGAGHKCLGFARRKVVRVVLEFRRLHAIVPYISRECGPVGEDKGPLVALEDAPDLGGLALPHRQFGT